MHCKPILFSMLVLLNAVQLTLGARVINIFDQKEGDDIVELRSGNGRMFNALHRNSNNKWPKSDDGIVYIPYKFADYTGYTREEEQNVTEAINRIRSNTCVHFVPWQGETDYIEIQNHGGEGCYTNVGRTRGKEILQLQSGSDGTCLTLNTVIHELMHVAGLWHEQMRYDRDRYIKIHYENIDPGMMSQFRKLTPRQATAYKVPYDYTSIMHYGKTAFSSNGEITMETWNPLYQDIIGTREDASPSDYKKICEIYQCAECHGGDIDNDSSITALGFDAGESRNSLGCQDLFPSTCKYMEENNYIECGYGRDVKICCATCQRWETKHGLTDALS